MVSIVRILRQLSSVLALLVARVAVLTLVETQVSKKPRQQQETLLGVLPP
jgi:hypothetical protein